VRGLAESLRNEMLLHDIRVSVFYPGNVDTPMLQHEIALTPPETKTIEGVSAPLSPEAAAQTLVNGVAKGHFSITTDPLVYLLRILSNGVTPRHNTVLEAAALPLIMVVQVGFLFFMDAVVGYSRWQRGKQRKSDKKGQ
jgi:3-dehydrosphinganine reductase